MRLSYVFMVGGEGGGAGRWDRAAGVLPVPVNLSPVFTLLRADTSICLPLENNLS